MRTEANDRALSASGTLLGIGMGGFVDGNWIPKDTIANVEINMVWDGLFHAFCWISVAVALALFWRALRRRGSLPPGRSCLGSIVMGWGIFNFTEGIVDHEILRVHHVFQCGYHLLCDLVFLASGLLLGIVGWALIRTAPADSGGSRAPVRA